MKSHSPASARGREASLATRRSARSRGARRAAVLPMATASLDVARILSSVVAQLPEPALLLDASDCVRAASPAGHALFGDVLAGMALDHLLSHLDFSTESTSSSIPNLAQLIQQSRAAAAGVESTYYSATTGAYRVGVTPFHFPDPDAGWVLLMLHRVPTPHNDDTSLDLLAEAMSAPLSNLKSASLALQSSTRRWDIANQLELVRIIGHEAETLQQALAGARELQALGHDRLALKRAPIELGDIVMEILAQWKTRAPDHSFELALPGELPVLFADAERVAEAFTLLLEYAVRLQPMGGPVRVTLRPHTDKTEVAIRIHGTTLPSDEFQSMFEPFHRPSSAPQATVRGGAGPAIARTLIQAHGGDVWATALPSGQGLELHCGLPHEPIPVSTHQEATNRHEVALPPRASTPVAAPRMHACVVIADKDPRMARYIRANLVEHKLQAVTAPDMAEMFHQIDLIDPDVILLDTQLLVPSWQDHLGEVLDYSRAAVILTSQHHDSAQAAVALEQGAADYIAKPFSIEEMLARVRVALRHMKAAEAPAAGVLRTGELTIDLEQRHVTVAGHTVALSKTEFKLLRALAQHPGMVLSHDVLLDRVWGPAYSHEVEFIWVYIRRLRRKLELDPRHPKYIQTVPGIGYRLCVS